MNSNRNTATIVGVLYILGTAAGVLSVVFTMPIFSAPGYLSGILENQNQIIIGALCVLTMGLALAMIPVVIYPIFKQYNQPLALGYVVFRGGLETFTYIVIVICWLVLIPLSQQYAKAGTVDAASFHALGVVIRKAADISANLTAIVFPLGAMMLYYFLYQSRLIPRWLSTWGMIGVGLHIVSTGLLGLFNLIDSTSVIQTASNLPIFLQEMVMAVWLIAKGFNPSAVAAEPGAPAFAAR